MPRGTVPLVSELEARIDEAQVIARASEEGVREVGEMALDAARQARRAAEAAEASARAAADLVLPAAAAEEPAPAEEHLTLRAAEAEDAPSPRFDVRLRSFSERADRVSARLRALADHPSRPAGPSAVAARRRGDY